MFNTPLYILAFSLFIVLQLNGQGRLVMNNDAFLVFSNGTAVNTPYVVIDNPNANGIMELGAGGNIISENEYHVVRWNIGATVGTYTLPFRSTTGNVKIPLVFQKTSAGAGGPNIDFSTYPTPNNNLAWPSTVTHLNSAQTGVDNSLNVIDRFWLIKANSYGTRPDFNMTFNYDIAETGGANTVVPGGMVAQRFNSSTNTWNGSVSNSSVFFGVDNSAQTRVENATAGGGELWEAWTLVNNTALLPVNITSFSGDCKNDAVHIQWTTASEENSSHFEIQKSWDGNNYQTLGQVDAAGNSSQPLHYSFVDQEGTAQVAYYRLKQIDYDGQSRVFQPISVSNCGQADNIVITDYNNGNVTVDFNLNQKELFTVSLYDMGGKLIQRLDPFVVNQGNNRKQLNLQDQANGIYLISVQSEQQIKSKKIIIQK